MAGHSKWANIKHRKGAQDALKAKIFNKFSKEIMVAVAKGGSDPNSNPALRLIISKARAKSMPKSNIEKAIAKGEGSTSNGENFKEIIYSGTLSHGISVIVVILTDNINRAIASLQALFRRANGQIGKQNSIPYLFEQKGYLEIEKNNLDEDDLMLFSLDNGAEDFQSDGENYMIYCQPRKISELKNEIEKKFSPNFRAVEISYFPNEWVELDQENTEKILNQIDNFLDDEDIQNVYHNLKFA
ncbi:YebC/PmpR family DNA-binding transcriptional regulator [Mesomycoplasma hyopneumoniae]|uniref:YebC/PmpR family DNA-binding transcriptional regulator n=1 Tax=Mesomycoplasma hyopneumoniae TaxID=2099 RepID=UPI0011B5EF6D|nr:YebC/PmpR family DNA-binding transcriptional regulator [Mesomycoplasma hyopneumoniae]MXR33826.1 YebC/PmpR family DNA-binding transcriptional regulator [Mesomycoplasma hyopneumoniae]NYN92092.1 YebC/PmpR family DNA-binding transcriptional regulator [Mesomycoplasma hyopneumoniae]QEA02682.1 YebC/PmpR family DNA-binding transcriptional regulator [Mesomycoplasma hyopneumoniae]